MLVGRYHHVVVSALIDAEDGQFSTARSSIETFVERQLLAMPAHIRAGVHAVGASLAVRHWGRARLDRWDASRFPPVRQYVRLLRSLVVFAAYEELW